MSCLIALHHLIEKFISLNFDCFRIMRVIFLFRSGGPASFKRRIPNFKNNLKRTTIMRSYFRPILGGLAAGVALAALGGLEGPSQAQAQERAKRPNIVMLMTDDTGWNDFGAYSGGGAGLGHPTPNVDQIAKEGAVFTNWYGQASCTAGRASFITGRIPIRSGLSVVVAPGDENFLRKETPTIAEFFKKNGYTTYFSGKWHLGDKPVSYPIEHRLRRDEELRRLLCRRLYLRRHEQVVPSLVPVVQSAIRQDVQREREPG
jgi:Sulfatase